MKPYWKYFLLSFFVLAILIAAWFGYRSYLTFQRKPADAIEAISPQTPLFVEIRNAKSTIAKLTGQTEFWKDLLGIEPVRRLNRQISKLDSILSSDSWTNEVYQDHKFYVSFFLTDSVKFDILYIAEIPLATTVDVANFIKGVNGTNSIVLQKEYNEAPVFLVNIPGFPELFRYSVYKGLFIGSFNEQLVEIAINQLNYGKPVDDDPQFSKVQITAGKNVDANLYINYSLAGRIASRFVSDDRENIVSQVTNLAEWTEADINFKSNEVLLNGYTITSDSVSDILDRFRQEPQPVTIPEILPYRVSTLFELGFERFTSYYAKMAGFLVARNKLQDFESQIRTLNTKFGVNLQEQFLSQIGSELAAARLGGDEHLVVVQTKDVKAVIQFLDHFATISSEKAGRKPFTEQTGDYTIRKLEVPGLMPELFGPLFASVTENYFLSIRDYIVFADSPQTLKDVIISFYDKKTLAEDINFKNFANNLSDRSNILYYCNTRYARKAIYAFLDDSISKVLSEADSVVGNFEGFGLQFSYSNRMFYTNFYLKYNPAYKEPRPVNREVSLESASISQPYMVRGEDGRMHVIVFDSLLNMYLIDKNLKIKWKKQLTEAPVSKVYEVENTKDKTVRYLFNTENYLYLIDDRGDIVSPFPVKLATRATNPVTVVDYDRNKEYRLILALDDNKIYNYSIDGTLVEGWEKVRAGGTVIRPVEYLANDGKDYLFIVDENDRVSIVNRRGEDRIKIKKGFRIAAHSKIYINETNTKGTFLTTDSEGKLIYISEEGKISNTIFGSFSANHYFLYEDFTGNHSKDFIFADSAKLVVYDRFKKIVFSHDLPFGITIKPDFITDRSGNGYLCLTDAKTGKVLIFDKNGQAFKNIDIKGTTPFATGNLTGDDHLNLLIGDGNKLMNYLLE